MPNGTERSLGERIKSKVCNHDWIHRWSERKKQCHKCNEVQPIEKEYSHDDESAEIGEKRVRIKERESSYRVDIEQYQNTAHGPDDAYFQWFPAGGFYANELELEELRDEVNRVLNTGTGRGDDDE